MKADAMSFETPRIDDPYRRYAQLLIAQHELLCRNASGDDVEVLEDEMTTLWDVLDAAQRHSLSGLGSDLNWLRRGGKLAPKAPSAQEVADDELRELYQARDRSDWHRTLHQLRLCSAKLAPFDVAFLRATAWQAIGLSEVAGLFSRFAAQLDPNNARLAILSLPIGPQPSTAGRAGSVD